MAHAKRVTVKSQHKQSTILELVLDEGRNREIRRLLAQVGHKVLRLKRTRSARCGWEIWRRANTGRCGVKKSMPCGKRLKPWQLRAPPSPPEKSRWEPVPERRPGHAAAMPRGHR